MVYKVIGTMSGSSLDGLDLAFVELEEKGGKWTYHILAAECYPYPVKWRERLQAAPSLPAKDYLLLHAEYGRYNGETIKRFIEEKELDYQVGFIASHGHTSFHLPGRRMTAQLGDGSAIAAVTGLPVISDLRAMDVALGGQGAPIVPVGEKFLFGEYELLLNLGGIANLSVNRNGSFIAFDICPANRVLNELARLLGKEYDENGLLAGEGQVDETLLQRLNSLPYYGEAYPKSLGNEFGTEVALPLVNSFPVPVQTRLRTFVEHIAMQTGEAVGKLLAGNEKTSGSPQRMLVTGGGAFNRFLVDRIGERLPAGVEITIPGDEVVQYKEALIMAFIGALRWRQQNTTFASVTGATRDSVGGALWMGQEY